MENPVRIIKTPNWQIQYCTKLDRNIARFQDILNWHQCPYQRKDKILNNNICTNYKTGCAHKRLFQV